MNIASRLTRRALLRPQLLRPQFQRRLFARDYTHPSAVAPAYKFNVIKRQGHGMKWYFQEWEALIFSHSDWSFATMWITIPSVIATVAMFYAIWNSAWRDPEVRFRPHKKGWHLEEGRANAAKYRFGAFSWYFIGRYNPTRVAWFRRIHEEGFDEPGQNGFEELPIPSLDE